MRRLAVRRVLAGETQAAVAQSLEVRETTVWKWFALYRAKGEDGLGSRTATGRPPTLTAKQRDRLKRIIIGKNPRQLNFGSALWSLPIVRQLVERLFGVVLHDTTVARMLRKLGLTPQKPLRRAFQRDDEECRRWATEVFPEIVRETKRKQATLLFLDETGVHEDGPTGTTWGKRGATPVVRVSGKRRRANVISAISPRGRLWFRCFTGTLGAAAFVRFLRDLLSDVRGKVVLVLDSHPAHTAAETRRFIHERRDRLSLHFLPGYAPDMNPDEHVWGHLKTMFRRNPLEEGADLIFEAHSRMETIAHDRSLVRAFFSRPQVSYVKEALKW
jgi:transposase